MQLFSNLNVNSFINHNQIMKKILISMVVFFCCIILTNILLYIFVGIENINYFEPKVILTENLIAKRAQIMIDYWITGILCILPTIGGMILVAYSFIIEFKKSL